MPEHDAQSMKPRRLHVLGFLEEIRHIHETMPERRFCFILGAGASKASGIPTAGELGREWLRWTHKKLGGKPEAFGEWLGAGSHGIPGLSPQIREADLGAFASAYPAIYRATWGHDPAQGQAELERHIEGKKPSYGYYALAGIMTDDKDGHPSRHNVVITPNFDNLPAEALGAMGRKVPIIIGHGAIAEYARPTLKRPLIVKFHHDYLLSPKSDPEEVCDLDQRYATALAKILGDYTPIVVGYGGNDGSLMKLLEGLPPGSIPGGLQWCWRQGEPPSERIERLVAKQGGALVEISGFDELMALLQKYLGGEVDPPTGARDNTAMASAATDALDNEATSAWRHWQDRVNASNGLDEQEKLYQEALAAMPKSAPLLGNYAFFLETQRGEFHRAEEHYRRALEADPKDADNLGNYALFLDCRRGDFNRAEEHYLRAIEADPKDAHWLGAYAGFLQIRRGEFDRAEEHYRRAIEADPENANNHANYARFLSFWRRDFDRAEEHYRRAVEADPKDAHWLCAYAGFLQIQREDFDRAEEHYRRAIETDPKDARLLDAYANFLEIRREDFDQADEYFRRAIEADPNDAYRLGNYAIFLETRRGEFDRAEEHYRRAVEAEPKDATNLGNYADFLENKREDFDRAEEYYRRAIEADPEDAHWLGNYAEFLDSRRGDGNRAEEQYRRAVEADPKHANNFCNFAQFLAGRGQWDKSEPLAELAWEFVGGESDAACAEVVFTRWLLAVVKGGDGNPALGRLKTLLRAGFERGPWSFDKMLAVCVPRLDEAHGRLARKLAEAILDGGKLDGLEEEALWRETPAIPLELPWK